MWQHQRDQVWDRKSTRLQHRLPTLILREHSSARELSTRGSSIQVQQWQQRRLSRKLIEHKPAKQAHKVNAHHWQRTSQYKGEHNLELARAYQPVTCSLRDNVRIPVKRNDPWETTVGFAQSRRGTDCPLNQKETAWWRKVFVWDAVWSFQRGGWER